jgi:hypothetical protein
MQQYRALQERRAKERDEIKEATVARYRAHAGAIACLSHLAFRQREAQRVAELDELRLQDAKQADELHREIAALHEQRRSEVCKPHLRSLTFNSVWWVQESELRELRAMREWKELQMKLTKTAAADAAGDGQSALECILLLA